MRKVTVAAIALAAGLGLAACSGSSTPPASPSAVPSSTTVTAAAASVTIQNMAFSPDTVTVKAGEAVMWTNQDSAAHTVTFDDPSITSSGDLAQGATFAATFPKAGTYTYHCTIHPNMTGTVTVT